MVPAEGERTRGETVRERYPPKQDRSLHEAVLEAHTDHDVLRAEFTLYDSIDPEALDNLFRHTQPRGWR